jgi:glycosyltransferase involved in cell wall biosynthesis
MTRLAIIATHPIQYYVPWYRRIAAALGDSFRVFYCWDCGIKETHDPGFGQVVQWDIPLTEGYPYTLVPNVAKTQGTEYFRGLQNPELYSKVAEWKPDAILLMAYKYQSLLHFIWKWRRHHPDVPLLFRGDSHRLIPRSGLKNTLKQIVLTQIYHKIQAKLYVGKSNKEYFLEHGVPESELFFCPHAIDNDRFLSQLPEAEKEAAAWRESLGIAPDEKVVLYVAKFLPRKRPLDLIKAFKQANVPKSRLLFAGSGPLEADMKAAAGDDARIVFAPFQNQSQMPRTYLAGDVMALPSYIETWGLGVNEAMICGRPVIVSTLLGCAADLVIEGETGWAITCGDIDELAGAITEALSPETALREMGQAAQQHIREHYSYATATDGLNQALVALGLQPIPPVAGMEASAGEAAS